LKALIANNYFDFHFCKLNSFSLRSIYPLICPHEFVFRRKKTQMIIFFRITACRYSDHGLKIFTDLVNETKCKFSSAQSLLYSLLYIPRIYIYGSWAKQTFEAPTIRGDLFSIFLFSTHVIRKTTAL
jgi:hypothetical protein